MVETYELPVKVKVTIPANTTANSVTLADFTVDPQEGAKKSITIPKGETWVLDDVWITGSQTPDGILKLIVDRTEVKVTTPPINTLLVSNPSRPTVKKEVFDEFSTIVGHFINLADVGTGGATVELYLKFVVFKD